MQTDIAVHDTDQKKGNTMNINSNHGNSRKDKQMNAAGFRITDVEIPITRSH